MQLRYSKNLCVNTCNSVTGLNSNKLCITACNNITRRNFLDCSSSYNLLYLFYQVLGLWIPLYSHSDAEKNSKKLRHFFIIGQTSHLHKGVIFGGGGLKKSLILGIWKLEFTNIIYDYIFVDVKLLLIRYILILYTKAQDPSTINDCQLQLLWTFRALLKWLYNDLNRKGLNTIHKQLY